MEVILTGPVSYTHLDVYKRQGQGVHIHIIVDHQQAAFQIGTGKAIVLDFLDATIAGGISHEPFQHQPDACLLYTSLSKEKPILYERCRYAGWSGFDGLHSVGLR